MQSEPAGVRELELDTPLIAPDEAGAPARISTGELTLVRRIDWRFLLPNPQLRRVLYFGDGHDSLEAALRLFSDSFALASPAEEVAPSARRDGELDLLVAQGVSPAELATVCRLVPPEGFLYWEIDRSPWFTVRGFRPVLRSLGFCNVKLYWHHPDFESCRQIVPLDDLPAVGCFLAEHGIGFRRSLGVAVARGLAALDLLARVLPCVGVVACRKGRDVE